MPEGPVQPSASTSLTHAFLTIEPRRQPEDAPDAAGPDAVRDRSLMARVAMGDADAFDRLIRHYWPPLVRYAGRMLGDVDAAKDAVQEALVRVWEHRADWSASSGTVQAYLYRITRNIALDVLRKREVRARWADRPTYTAHSNPRTPAEQLELEELTVALERAVQALPHRRREVFILVFFQGLSYRDAAAALSVSPKTIANQMWAAYSDVRKALRRFRPR